VTTDQEIALVTSAGACLSAIATFWTVLQIKKQREASYRPELVFSRSYFTAIAAADEGARLLTQWVAGARCDLPPSPQATKPLAIPLRNVGLAAAKDLTIQWSFPLEQTVDYVNKVAQRTLTPAYFSINDLGVSFESETLGKVMSMWRNQARVELDFVLPASVEEEPLTVELPHAYVLLSSAVVFFDWKDKEGKNAAKFQMPVLSATIGYSDIADGSHRTSFELRPEVTMVSDTAFTGIFVSAKVK
jgi:hypothetical protein